MAKHRADASCRERAGTADRLRCRVHNLNGSQAEMKADIDGGVQFRNTGTAKHPAGTGISIATRSRPVSESWPATKGSMGWRP